MEWENRTKIGSFSLTSAPSVTVIGVTVFPHKTTHKTTWVSPDGKTENQIDHLTIGRKWRRSLLDVRVRRGADAASDHHLVVAMLRTKLKAYKDQADVPAFKYNVHSLKDKAKVNEYKVELKNKFIALEGLAEETVENQWHGVRNI